MKKCIKNYCTSATQKKISLLYKYAAKYNRCKNLFYTLYWNRPDIVFTPYKYAIRDKLVKLLQSKSLNEEQYRLLLYMPSKAWKCALQEALSDLKAMQTTRKNNIKYKITQNSNLEGIEKTYLLYLLKSDNLLNCLLKKKKFQINDFYEVDKDKMHRYLKRLLKDFPIKKPYAKRFTYVLDGSTQLTYFYQNDKLYISIPTLIKRYRVRLPLTDRTMRLKGNVRVILDGNRIEFHKAIDVKPKVNYGNKDVYLALSMNHLINVGFEKHQLTLIDNLYDTILRYQRKPTKRNWYSIEHVVNDSIQTFINNANPRKVIMKNLEKDFITYTPNVINKKTYTKVTRYIKDRLIYKLSFNGIELEFVNAAYTDKICSKCHSFDTVRTNNGLECKECTLSVEFIANSLSNIKLMHKLGVGINAPQSVAKRLVEQFYCPVQP